MAQAPYRAQGVGPGSLPAQGGGIYSTVIVFAALRILQVKSPHNNL